MEETIGMKEIIVDYSLWIIILNVVLMFAIKYIIQFFVKEEQQGNIFKFRLINVGFIILLSLSSMMQKHQDLLVSMFMTLFVLYVAALLYELLAYIILQRSGTKIKIQDVEKQVDNHNTRIMSLLAMGFLGFVTVIILINVWGFDSALEAGGLVGALALPLVVTASYWSPDLISGVQLLNNKFINDGDTIEYKGRKYLMYKFGFFETVLLDTVTDNRVFIKNAQLRDEMISNLSKLANASGLREVEYYTIGYRNDESYEDYFKKLSDAVQNVQDCFYKISAPGKYVNDKVDIEMNVVKLNNNGIDIMMAYYLNSISSYRTTKKLRSAFGKTKSDFNKTVIIEFQKKGIYVDTPTLISKVEDFREPVLPAAVEENRKKQ